MNLTIAQMSCPLNDIVNQALRLELPQMNASEDDEWSEGSDAGMTDVLTEEDQEVKEPSRYRVILLNDDYTSMEFVVYILSSIFHKTAAEAEAIMLKVHNSGEGLAGVYVKEVAESKVAKVHRLAKQEQFPLKCRMDRE